jgi:hypothetical protein
MDPGSIGRSAITFNRIPPWLRVLLWGALVLLCAFIAFAVLTATYGGGFKSSACSGPQKLDSRVSYCWQWPAVQ